MLSDDRIGKTHERFSTVCHDTTESPICNNAKYVEIYVNWKWQFHIGFWLTGRRVSQSDA